MPLNIELLKQVKKQILSHPEKFRMDRMKDCGCIADFVVAGEPTRISDWWVQVRQDAEWELYAEGHDPLEIAQEVRRLFYPEQWDKDLFEEWQKVSFAPTDLEFQKLEAQLAAQMIDRLIAKYPPVEA
jgi:hypothetical protein